MTAPFVSVLIDTYNHERFIEHAVRSVLEQDYPSEAREILVVDDGSTDRTPEIVRKFEPQVRLLRKTNGGQASAFNAGIPECRGEIIAFLDGDDWWVREKLRRVVEVFSSNPTVGMVGHGIIESSEGRADNIVAPEKSERLRLDSLAPAQVFRLRKSFLGTSRLAIRAGLARRILPVPDALVIEADEYLFTMAAALCETVILRDALTHYRLHGGNLYLGAAANKEGHRRKQRVHAALVAALGRDLGALGVPRNAVECVTEVIAAEADQMRLMLDGGAPWETLRAEQRIYEIMHSDAPLRHRLFRRLTMLSALFLPPRWFYAARLWISSRPWYRGARAKVLPVPKITRVADPEEFKA